MKNPYFRAKTLDDLLRYALQRIEKYGEPVKASKGRTREITGVVLELTNPRARLSRTESRGKLFSCIGELCWYLKGTNRTAFIVHYIEALQEIQRGRPGLWRIRPAPVQNWKGAQQFENLIKLLRAETDVSRQSGSSTLRFADLAKPHKDVRAPVRCNSLSAAANWT